MLHDSDDIDDATRNTLTVTADNGAAGVTVDVRRYNPYSF